MHDKIAVVAVSFLDQTPAGLIEITPSRDQESGKRSESQQPSPNHHLQVGVVGVSALGRSFFVELLGPIGLREEIAEGAWPMAKDRALDDGVSGDDDVGEAAAERAILLLLE